MEYYLHVRVIEAKGLPKVDTFGTIDPYVVLQTNSGEKYRTRYRKNDMEPVWNEEFTFRVRANGEVLRISLYDYNDLASNKRISEAKINVNSFKPSEVLDTWYQLTPLPDYMKGGQIHLKIHLATSAEKKFEGTPATTVPPPAAGVAPPPPQPQSPYPAPQSPYPAAAQYPPPQAYPPPPPHAYPPPPQPYPAYPAQQPYPPAAYPPQPAPSPQYPGQYYTSSYPPNSGYPPQYPPPPPPPQYPQQQSSSHQYVCNGYPGTYRI